jgi:hypothetical protein
MTDSDTTNNPYNVLVATPSYDGKFEVRYVESLLNTISIASAYNIRVLPYFLCYDSLVQRPRNDYFRTAYYENVDALFFIDADIGFNPNDFIKLCKSPLDMVGATYRKKIESEELYAFKCLEKNGKFHITPDANGMLEVAGLGCGFLKLSRKAVKTLFEEESNLYHDASDPSNQKLITKSICECVLAKQGDNTFFISEDIVMCMKWRNLGGKVWLDTNINCSHTGPKSFDSNLQSWLKEWEKKLSINKPSIHLDKFINKFDSDKDFKLI